MALVASGCGFLDTVFDDHALVLAARAVMLAAALALLMAGVYVVGSTVVRIRRGEWLSRAGPFESELATNDDALLLEPIWFSHEPPGAALEAASLRARLAKRDDLIERLFDERVALLRQLEDRNEP